LGLQLGRPTLWGLQLRGWLAGWLAKAAGGLAGWLAG